MSPQKWGLFLAQIVLGKFCRIRRKLGLQLGVLKEVNRLLKG
jgi:hypothetical protein